jgi:hypothetical protein
MGSLDETREDLSHYHPELKQGTDSDSDSLSTSEMFAAGVLNADVLNQAIVVLGSEASVVIAM